jgi:hypothetical protein
MMQRQHEVTVTIENRSFRRAGASSGSLRKIPSRAAIVGGFLLAGLLAGAGACSLVVEDRENQCETDADCSRLAVGAVCRSGICAPADGAGDQCFEGEPSTNDEFLNRCTDAQCTAFDNCARLGLCDGAELPALVDPVNP